MSTESWVPVTNREWSEASQAWLIGILISLLPLV